MHVEYEWNLRQEEMDESDDDLDDKVSARSAPRVPTAATRFSALRGRDPFSPEPASGLAT